MDRLKLRALPVLHFIRAQCDPHRSPAPLVEINAMLLQKEVSTVQLLHKRQELKRGVCYGWLRFFLKNKTQFRWKARMIRNKSVQKESQLQLNVHVEAVISGPNQEKCSKAARTEPT